MPLDQSIKSILVIGSGPIIIGQACEFDYSGTQACRVLKENGLKVTLINSNPATIMTDSDTANEIYIEPIIPEVIEKICLKEKIDSVLPTVGGQTGLNVVVKVAKTGFFEKNGIQIIGADIHAIKKAEDRNEFKKVISELGYKMSDAYYIYNLEEAMNALKNLSFPIIIRASYTLGGSGGSVAKNIDEYKTLIEKGLSLSMINEVVVEKSILGWKEYELEVMKDSQDNVVIICSIENIDPIGIHTGDSITVAPQQTLSDKEYQQLRDMSIAIIKKIGVTTGGANIQFAIHPETREVLVIEMNPRVSRSSALASKATGFPIAKIAAKLAIGYSLDEIPNDITRSTPASFEPTLDYVVTKIPKFAFEKFISASPYLGIQMKSVGETMAIGRSFRESIQKAIRGLEVKRYGFDGICFSYDKIKSLGNQALQNFIKTQKEKDIDLIKKNVFEGHYQRIFYLKDLFFLKLSVGDIYNLCQIDHWFLQELKAIFDLERYYWKRPLEQVSKDDIRLLKENGFSDVQLSYIFDRSEDEIREWRKKLEILPVYKIVDTCAGEFEAQTPYYYSSYDEENELHSHHSKKEKIIIIGGGPNRIGQGIEFDYMCVHASKTLRKMGYESVIINSNPETVSTDYDTSDLLFFEPLTLEDTLNIIEAIKPIGIIVHYGGQTPLNLAKAYTRMGVKILGTSFHSIKITEDRKSFKNILQKLNFLQPVNDTVVSIQEAKKTCTTIGYPVLLRPSFVLGGARMRIVYDEEELNDYFNQTIEDSDEYPVLIDKYLENAIEVDVDLISDGEHVVICGIMEHIEAAGVHSGDSACILPPQSLPKSILNKIIKQSTEIALELEVKGPMNIQFAIKQDNLFFIEVNPRGSRTLPFVSKSTGIPWVQLATKVTVGKHLTSKDISLSFPNLLLDYVCVKEAVLPFDKFPNEDTILSPEMKSTGEVMGIGKNKAEAFYKSQIASDSYLPKEGGVLISIKTKKAEAILDSCRILSELGFTLYATEGTYHFLKNHKILSKFVYKLGEGKPDIRDFIIDGKIHLIYNTPIGKEGKISDHYIRLLAKQYKISIYTETNAMIICSQAIKEYSSRNFEHYSLKSFNRNIEVL